MIIDFHTHVQTPEQQADPLWQGRCPMTIENVLEAQKGPDHFIFGTDAPPLKVLKKQGVEVIKKIGLSPTDESKVCAQNAKRLLKI